MSRFFAEIYLNKFKEHQIISVVFSYIKVLAWNLGTKHIAVCLILDYIHNRHDKARVKASDRRRKRLQLQGILYQQVPSPGIKMGNAPTI